ncbi:MAG: efflux RND transporter permease subunit [Caldilineaceae bacterium]
MLRWLVDFSLRLRFVMLILAVVIISAGVIQMRKAPVDVLPEFNPPLVEIQTEALGLSQDEVEQMITVPMEQDLLNGVPWLREIRSESIPGLSSITLLFDDGVDLVRARQMVTERLAQAFALPHVSKPPTMLQPMSATNRVMMIGLSSKDLSLIEMSVQARWTIAPRLMGVPGVANVSIWGQRDRQLQVQVDPQKLKDQKVTLLQVLETAGNAMWVSSLSFLEASTPGTGGFVDTQQQRLGIRHILPIVSADGLSQVPVEESKLRLGDVATVVEDHQPLIGDAVSSDGGGLLLVVEKLPGANTLEVTKGLEEALTALRPGLPGVDLDSSLFHPATFIEQVIANLRWIILLGGLLLLLAFAALYFEWRSTLVTLLSLPLPLATAGLILAMRGATFNIILFTGLAVALGVVIDDIVIVVENVLRRVRQQQLTGSDKPARLVVWDAVLEMHGTILFSTLIILLPLLPFFFMESRTDAFLDPMLVSYALAIIASLLVGLSIVPAFCLILLSNPRMQESRLVGKVPGSSPILAGLQRIYGSILTPISKAPVSMLVVALVLLVVGVGLVLPLGRSIMPTFREPTLLVSFDNVPGASLSEMDRIVSRVVNDLRATPGVSNVGAHVGRAVMSDQVAAIHSGELWVNIDPSADYDATVAAVRQVINSYPGIKHSVQTYLNTQSRDVLNGVEQTFGVRIFGEKIDKLNETADEVVKTLQGIAGITSMKVERPSIEPNLNVVVDMAKAEKYGIKPGDVRRTATTLLSGLQVGSLFEDQKVFDVVVIGTPATRQSLTKMNDLLIDTPDGGTVRLGDVATVSIAPIPTSIRHIAVSPYIDINITVDGRKQSAVAADIQQRLPTVTYPAEFHAEIFGNYAQQDNLQNRMNSLIAAALIGIFLLLQAAFGGWRLAFFYLLSLPVALFGGVIGVWLDGGVLSLGSAVGFLLVFGVAVRNGMVLINHYHNLQLHAGQEFNADLIRRGAQERMSAILITALATALAFLPALIAGDMPGNEILRPMAVVVLGGLVTSTLLNLLIVPAIYQVFGFKPEAEESYEVAGHEPSFGMAAD